MTHYKPNQDKTMLVEVPKEMPWKPIGRALDSLEWSIYRQKRFDYTNIYLPSLRKIPAHPSLIEWMQREGKEVITDKEFELKSRCCGRCDGKYDICVADETCKEHLMQGCEICFGARMAAYPLPQTDDDGALWNRVLYMYDQAKEHGKSKSDTINHFKSHYSIKKL